MEERDEIERYLTQVLGEVARRREIVRAVEQTMSALEGEIRRSSGGSTLDVSLLKVSEGRRAQLAKELVQNRKKLENAQQDLQSALHREMEVREELAALGDE